MKETIQKRDPARASLGADAEGGKVNERLGEISRRKVRIDNSVGHYEREIAIAKERIMELYQEHDELTAEEKTLTPKKEGDDV